MLAALPPPNTTPGDNITHPGIDLMYPGSSRGLYYLTEYLTIPVTLSYLNTPLPVQGFSPRRRARPTRLQHRHHPRRLARQTLRSRWLLPPATDPAADPAAALPWRRGQLGEPSNADRAWIGVWQGSIEVFPSVQFSSDQFKAGHTTWSLWQFFSREFLEGQVPKTGIPVHIEPKTGTY